MVDGGELLSMFEIRRLQNLYESYSADLAAAGRHFRQALALATAAAAAILYLGRNPEMSMVGLIGALSLIMCEGVSASLLVFFGFRWINVRSTLERISEKFRENDRLACPELDVLD